MSWQRKVRFAMAMLGFGFLVLVFLSFEGREPLEPQPVPARLDPKSILESSEVIFRQLNGIEKNYEVQADQQLVYEDGSVKLFDVVISVRGRTGEDFLITGREALAEGESSEIVVQGSAKLSANDGLEVLSDNMEIFTEPDGIVRAPGPLSFSRGRFNGTGVGMTYDNASDVLTIDNNSKVNLGVSVSEEMEFEGGSSTFSRRGDFLLIEHDVQARRGGEVLKANQVTAYLTENEEGILYLELRGNAYVLGDSDAFDYLAAENIDLDYSDDGKSLEQIKLSGQGKVALASSGTQAGTLISAGSLVIDIDSEGSLSAVTGGNGIQFYLPLEPEPSARTIRAQSIDAIGIPGGGLTSALFLGDIEYKEKASASESVDRVISSEKLEITLQDKEISNAIFTKDVQFEGDGIVASAGEVLYNPLIGILELQQMREEGLPHVEDSQVDIRAEKIEVGLKTLEILASGAVKTELQPNDKQPVGKLPGLLVQGQPAYAHAEKLNYNGKHGRGFYEGDAQLWQGETALRANRILLDRSKGDLTAIGNARSLISFSEGLSTGEANEIHYEEAARRIQYLTEAPSNSEGSLATLSGPQGNLSAREIVAILSTNENHVDRLEAHDQVTVRLDSPPDIRVATGENLIYYSADERYEISSPSIKPVKVIEKCRETIGQTLTFFKTANQITVDGNNTTRTQTSTEESCQETGTF